MARHKEFLGMSKVTIYQFTVLDPSRAERLTSRRWGTREGIQSRKDFAQIRILEDTAKEVDASAVDSMGFTKLDFDPAPGRWPRRIKRASEKEASNGFSYPSWVDALVLTRWCWPDRSYSRPFEETAAPS